jgi:hypothetical protein
MSSVRYSYYLLKNDKLISLNFTESLKYPWYKIIRKPSSNYIETQKNMELITKKIQNLCRSNQIIAGRRLFRNETSVPPPPPPPPLLRPRGGGGGVTITRRARRITPYRKQSHL